MNCKKLSLYVIQIFFILLVLVGLASCTSDVTDKYILQMVKVENAEDFHDIYNGYVYFGRDTCSTCNAFSVVLNQVSLEKNISIYYFDTEYFRENKLLEESELESIFNEYQILVVPTVIKICDGEVVNTFIPKFNEEKNNTEEVSEMLIQFFEE